MATGITDAAQAASIGNQLVLATLSQNTPAYFKTKITAIFMLLVYRVIHNVFACRKLGNVLLSSVVLEIRGGFLLPRENYTDSLEQINFYL